jgi:hypothetical protein
MKLVLVLSSTAIAVAQTCMISTLAGGAPPLTPVRAASAIYPNLGIAADRGNPYFVGDNCVFKIDLNGVLTRAGNSRWGSTGDGGPAIYILQRTINPGFAK